MSRSWTTFVKKNSWNSLQNKPAILSDNQISFSEIINKPTTLSGYNITPNIQTVTKTAIATPIAGSDVVRVFAQDNTLTLANPTGAWVEGKSLIITILTERLPLPIYYGSKYRPIGVALPTTATLNKMIYLGCIYNSLNDSFDVINVSKQV